MHEHRKLKLHASEEKLTIYQQRTYWPSKHRQKTKFSGARSGKMASDPGQIRNQPHKFLIPNNWITIKRSNPSRDHVNSWIKILGVKRIRDSSKIRLT